MRFLILAFVIQYSSTIHAQPSFSKIYRTDTAKTTQTSFSDILIIADTYFISGNQKIMGDSLNEGILMKVDSNGQVLWSKNYGDTTHSLDFRYDDMFDTGKGYFAITGYNIYEGTSSLLFIDFDGYLLYEKNFTSNIGINHLRFTGLTQDNANNFYIYGDYKTDPYTFKPILIKTDSIGNEYWRKTFDISPYEDGYAVDIIPIGNNEFILSAILQLNELQQLSFKEGTWLMKIDSAGNILNDYRTPFNNRWIEAVKMLKTNDGGLVFCSYEAKRDNNLNWDYEYFGYVAKLDSSFQLLWEKRYGGVRSFFVDVKEKDNGDLLLTGQIVSNFLPDSVQYSGWLISLNENGDSLWERKFHFVYDAAYPFHIARDFEILDDGGLAICGYMNNIRVHSTTYGSWGWLIRTDSFGCIVPGCQLLDNTEDIKILFDNEVTVFPNPASDVVNFRFDKVINEKAVIRVYSGLGQLVGQTASPLPTDVMRINVSDWQSGMYFYGVYVENRLVKQGQIVIKN